MIRSGNRLNTLANGHQRFNMLQYLMKYRHTNDVIVSEEWKKTYWASKNGARILEILAK